MEISEQKGQRVLQPSKYRLDTLIKEIKPLGRRTAALVITDGTSVLLTQSRKDLNRDKFERRKPKKFVCPQGGFSCERDKDLFDVFRREGEEEVGLDFRCFRRDKKPILLGECLNPMPFRSPYEFKHLFVTAIPVWYRDWVILNSENVRYEWVGSRVTLMKLIGSLQEVRPVKFWMIINAIDDMAKAGLLSWSSGFNTARLKAKSS